MHETVSSEDDRELERSARSRGSPEHSPPSESFLETTEILFLKRNTNRFCRRAQTAWNLRFARIDLELRCIFRVLRWCRTRTIDGSNDSRGPWLSRTLSTVRIGLETTEIQVKGESVAGRRSSGTRASPRARSRKTALVYFKFSNSFFVILFLSSVSLHSAASRGTSAFGSLS